jgi:hypothetical protein
MRRKLSVNQKESELFGTGIKNVTQCQSEQHQDVSVVEVVKH